MVDVDPVQLGLAHGGGKPLPAPLLAKMEAAFGADFSAVRVHVGPQASRIGAIAFTTGNDLYFAPHRFQPESMQGQQLIGHELAHVIQQRQGRVRKPASGIAVVQDRVLELEADRLGTRAAMHRAQDRSPRAPAAATRADSTLQAKPLAGPPAPASGPRPTSVRTSSGRTALIQRMITSGAGGGGNGGGNPNNGSQSSTDPPPFTGKLSERGILWRRRLWEHFGTRTFTVDEFCLFVGGFNTITTRSSQLELLRELRKAGALFPEITEMVRDGLVLSFDEAAAQQAPDNSGHKVTNREAFGMANPPHDHRNMVAFWARQANTPPPKGRDPQQHYMSPSRNFRIGDNDGNPVLDDNGDQVLEQGHSNLVMGHHPSASTYINATGHMHSPGTNKQHNYSPSAYGQAENKYASASSGSKEPRYRSPSPTRGSWEGYYQSGHPRFKPAYRQLWPSHIRRQCRHCGNDSDHEKRFDCSVCGTSY